MVTIDQAMRGILRFADTEIIPHLPTGKGIGAGIVLALIMDGGKEQVLKLRDNPAVQMMHVMDDTGNIDLDRLYNIARPKMDGQKLWPRSAAFHRTMCPAADFVSIFS